MATNETTQSPEDETSLQEQFLTSARDGNISVFMDFLNRKNEIGLDLEYQDSNGHTVLKIAIEEGYSGESKCYVAT